MSSNSRHHRHGRHRHRANVEPVIHHRDCKHCKSPFDTATEYETYCDSCKYVIVSCYICSATFPTSRHDNGILVYNKLRHFCSQCNSIRDSMEQWELGDKLLEDYFSSKPGFHIKLIITVITQEHDGYCSDSRNDRSSDVEIVKYYPVSLLLTRDDFNVVNMVDPSNPKLLIYIPSRFSTQYISCCGKHYTIKSAQLVQDLRDLFFA